MLPPSALFLALLAAQEPRDPFPGSRLGDCVRTLVESINSDDAAKREEFVRTRVSSAGLAEIAVPERLALLEAVRRQSGGLEVSQSWGTDPLETIVRTRTGGRWVRIYAFGDRAEPERVKEYGFVPIRDPALEAELAWPKAQLDEEGVVKEIERQFGGAAKRDEFAGVVLVAKGERVLFHRAYGFADRSWQAPNRPDTKFNLASMGKMFTAVAIGQLLEAGELELEARLGEVLPSYPGPEAAQRITVAQLLSHTAGLGMLFDRPGFDRRKRYRAQADYFPVFAGAPLRFEPGRESGYSNEGYVVLGAILEELTGRDYYEHVRERVFRPAGMDDTGFYALDDVTPNLATGYAHFEDDPLALGPWRPNWIYLQWKGCAAGGGYSTAPDLLAFTRALRSNRLVKAELTEELLRPHGLGGWYGYGFMQRSFGGKSARGHGGGGPGSGIDADLAWFVDGSYTAIVLGNLDMTVGPLFEGLMVFLARQ